MIMKKLPGVKMRPYRKTSRRCWEIAWRFVDDNPDWTLVHGKLNLSAFLLGSMYANYDHAWAKRGDYIFDPNHNGFFSKKEWKEFRPKEIKTYSAYTASREMLNPKHGKCHYGPWDAAFFVEETSMKKKK
jgi:hypothetical protein